MTTKTMTTKDVSEIATAGRLAAPIFAARKWAWYGNDHIPGSAEIADSIFSLARGLSDGEGESVSSGRLMVRRGLVGLEVWVQLADLQAK